MGLREDLTKATAQKRNNKVNAIYELWENPVIGNANESHWRERCPSLVWYFIVLFEKIGYS